MAAPVTTVAEQPTPVIAQAAPVDYTYERIEVDANVGQERRNSTTVPPGAAFQLTDVVVQNPHGDLGMASLLILHGYYDHVGLYRHVVEWGLRMGFAVLACDLPGHGLSSGARASINEFVEYQAVLQRLDHQQQRTPS